MAKVRFVLNRKGLRDEVLKSDGVAALLTEMATRRAPQGTRVESGESRSRANVTIIDDSLDAMDREAKTGHLSRALGGA